MALALAPNLEHMSAEELLGYVAERFHPRLYVACSFQKESTVIMDMLLRIEPGARFFTLDTGLLFPETSATWRRLQERYGVKVDVYQGISVARQRARHGDRLWERDPDACCGIRKLEPLAEALAGVDAWTTGVRRQQSPERAGTPKLHWDERHDVWKGNPLADWTEKDVWRYVIDHELPYHPLHDRGYDSIGCTHCTRPGRGRTGRWAGFEKTECGLH